MKLWGKEFPPVPETVFMINSITDDKTESNFIYTVQILCCERFSNSRLGFFVWSVTAVCSKAIRYWMIPAKIKWKITWDQRFPIFISDSLIILVSVHIITSVLDVHIIFFVSFSFSPFSYHLSSRSSVETDQNKWTSAVFCNFTLRSWSEVPSSSLNFRTLTLQLPSQGSSVPRMFCCPEPNDLFNQNTRLDQPLPTGQNILLHADLCTN